MDGNPPVSQGGDPNFKQVQYDAQGHALFSFFSLVVGTLGKIRTTQVTRSYEYDTHSCSGRRNSCHGHGGDFFLRSSAKKTPAHRGHFRVPLPCSLHLFDLQRLHNPDKDWHAVLVSGCAENRTFVMYHMDFQSTDTFVEWWG